MYANSIASTNFKSNGSEHGDDSLLEKTIFKIVSRHDEHFGCKTSYYVKHLELTQ